jgi:hypothetical protein
VTALAAFLGFLFVGAFVGMIAYLERARRG